MLWVSSCPSFWGQLGFAVPLLGWWIPSLQPAMSRRGGCHGWVLGGQQVGAVLERMAHGRGDPEASAGSVLHITVLVG